MKALNHEWQDKVMEVPTNKTIKVCEWCGVLFRAGLNDNNFCGTRANRRPKLTGKNDEQNNDGQ